MLLSAAAAKLQYQDTFNLKSLQKKQQEVAIPIESCSS